MRTLILLAICAAFAVVPYLEAKLQGEKLKQPIRQATIGWCVGMAACWILVRVLGMFDGWGR
jgi:flagellar biosynthesis protein FliR